MGVLSRDSTGAPVADSFYYTRRVASIRGSQREKREETHRETMMMMMRRCSAVAERGLCRAGARRRPHTLTAHMSFGWRCGCICCCVSCAVCARAALAEGETRSARPRAELIV